MWKVVGGAVLMIGLLALYAALNAHTAVAMGALDKPAYGCLEPAQSGKRDALVDRAFARAVARHDLPEGTGSSEWHFRQAFAYVGSKIAFSADERQAMVLPSLEALPVCKRQESTA